MSTEIITPEVGTAISATPIHQQMVPIAGAPVAPIAAMLKAVVEKGITSDNIAGLERLVALYEREQARDAERQFTAAFVALQADLPVIVASTVIQNRGKYERYEDVMRVVAPLLVKHGFTVSFSMDYKDTRILETCQLRHVGGHSQSNSFAVRTGRADTETQADCKAATTAKRNALLNCLNIVIRQDVFIDEDNAANDGAPLAPDRAIYLRELCAEVGADVPRFLAFAGAAKFEEIGSAKYDLLVASLLKKKAAR